MTTQTLTELKKKVHDDLVVGVVEDIIDVNPFFSFVPFTGYDGDAISFNRETTLGDAGFYGVGDTITHRNPSTVTKGSVEATKIIGQTDIDDLVQGQGESGGVSILADELSSKSKTVGRLFQQGMAEGDGTGNNMWGLPNLVDSSQYTAASAGQNFTLDLLDQLLELIKAKDGEVDWIQGPPVLLRQYKAAYRALGGGNPETIVLKMPNGQTRSVLMYEDIPIFRNDWLSTTETANGAALTGGSLYSVYAGCFDDGTKKIGCTGIYPSNFPAGGTSVKFVGTSETKDEDIYRVRMYANFFNFNRRALGRLPSLNVTPV